MVRRAEFALGKAIRAGQERGDIASQGQIGRGRTPATGVLVARPYDYATKGELGGADGSDGIYAMVDGTSPEQFEEALADARAEGNVSRANVVVLRYVASWAP